MMAGTIPAPRWMPKAGSKPASNQRTDDAYCDVGDQAEASPLYDLPGKPSRNQTHE
jgi:hypothetical protein